MFEKCLELLHSMGPNTAALLISLTLHSVYNSLVFSQKEWRDGKVGRGGGGVSQLGASLQWHAHNKGVLMTQKAVSSLYAIAETRCVTTERPEEP